MRRALRWFWKTGMLSTFLAGLFAVLPIVITVSFTELPYRSPRSDCRNCFTSSAGRARA